MAVAEEMLRAEALRKEFGSFTAVDDVSFHIDKGEIFSLLGPNGAGKTTTISMLSCLLAPTSGDAVINGHSVTKEPLAVKQAIGYVPQELALYETLSARQNLSFWGSMYGMSRGEMKERSTAVLAKVGLQDRADDRVETFSGGMKRRLNIAVGLLHQPRLVFMDEPTVGIDPQSRRSILDMVLALRDAGMTVLYTTHYMEEAQELSDRVGIIDHGRMIACGTQKELTKLVGQQETLRLHVGEEVDREPLVNGLQTAAEINQVAVQDGEITVTVDDAAEALPVIIAQAGEHHVRIRSIDIEEPNLETVFLHLTGRALRD